MKETASFRSLVHHRLAAANLPNGRARLSRIVERPDFRAEALRAELLIRATINWFEGGYGVSFPPVLHECLPSCYIAE